MEIANCDKQDGRAILSANYTFL